MVFKRYYAPYKAQFYIILSADRSYAASEKKQPEHQPWVTMLQLWAEKLTVLAYYVANELF